jgi:hypothetical protein
MDSNFVIQYYLLFYYYFSITMSVGTAIGTISNSLFTDSKFVFYDLVFNDSILLNFHHHFFYIVYLLM